MSLEEDKSIISISRELYHKAIKFIFEQHFYRIRKDLVIIEIEK